jgi:hypothetical protein
MALGLLVRLCIVWCMGVLLELLGPCDKGGFRWAVRTAHQELEGGLLVSRGLWPVGKELFL